MTDVDLPTVLRERIVTCQLCRRVNQPDTTCRDEATQPVSFAFPFGASVPPPVLVVGRNPGHDEDLAGMPFVGRSGRLLTGWLQTAGLDREHDVIVTNLVKCYTERNREPKTAEIVACSRFLHAELLLFRPRLVIGFGAQVARELLRAPLSECSGRVYAPRLSSPSLPSTFVTVHPSAALRNPSMKNRFWRDAETLRLWIEANLPVRSPA